MNPNKKDNNGWILCPSKSFPGKFYYFNVLNGEAAWSVNDADQNSLRRDFLHKADKSHTYPEPSSPPEESPTTKVGVNMQKIVPNITRRFTNVPQTTPLFGQATFPTYISNDPYMQNIIWTPIPLPMFSSNIRQEPVAQTWEPNRGIFVQSCSIPLSKRFSHYEEPKTDYFNSNTNLSSQNIESMKTFTNNFNENHQYNRLFTNSQTFGPIVHGQDQPIKKVVGQRTQLESDSIVDTFYKNNEPEVNVFNSYIETGKNNNTVTLKRLFTNSQTFGPIVHGQDQPIKKVVGQRTQLESDSIVDTFYKNNEPEVNVFNSYIETGKNNNTVTLKRVGRPRTLSESNSIIFEKPFEHMRSIFEPNFKVNSKVLSEREIQPESAFTLRKPIFDPDNKAHCSTYQMKNTGHMEKDKKQRECSLWCNLNKKENNSISLFGSAFDGNKTLTTYEKNTGHMEKEKKQRECSLWCNLNKKENNSISLFGSAFDGNKTLTTYEKNTGHMEKNNKKEGESSLWSNLNRKENNNSSILGTTLNPGNRIRNSTFHQNTGQIEKDNYTSSLFNAFNPGNKIHNTTSQNNTGQMKKDKKRENSILNFNKVNENCLNENDKSDFLNNLDKNDLRYTLERKRRKSVDLGSSKSNDGDHFKVSMVNHKQKEPVKKRVMFDLESSEGSADENGINGNQPDRITIQSLRRLTGHDAGYWYIVVDSNVLLEDYDFIDKFVLSDKDCRLFIPNAVQAEIERFCFGDCRGQQRVIVARQLTRKLAAPPSHIFVQPADKEDEIYTEMSTAGRILNCCLQIDQNDHMVLVTDDSILYDKAKALNIHCYKLKVIKDGATDVPEIKKTLANETKQNFLLFQNNSKKILNKENSVKNCDVQPDMKVTTDANTSPIKFEETKVKSKMQDRDYLNFDFDSDSDTTVISKTMKKLLIKDKICNFIQENSNITKLDGSKNGTCAFQIKNKNVTNKKESNHLQKSKMESVVKPKELKQNAGFQIQTEKLAANKINETNLKNNSLMKEEFKNRICEKLKQRFQVNSKFMAENVSSNIDEWICTFRQIMEHALSECLENHQSIPFILPPPWTLHEAVTYIKKLFENILLVTILADEMSLLLLNNCCKRGEIKRSIKPEEFTRVFGCGVMLVETLQAIESCPSLSEAQQLLRDMYRAMQNGQQYVELVKTPVLSRGDDDEDIKRQNFAKKSSEIIQYLKTHYAAWKSYSESPPIPIRDEMITQNDKKIVRTSGRNLNLLTIDKTKSMTLRNSTDNLEIENQKLSKPTSEIPENSIMNSQSTIKLCENNEPKIIRVFDTSTPFPRKNDIKQITNGINLTPKHGNTFDDKDNTDGPKVIRNLKLIDAFEEKIKSISKNEEELSYSPIDESISLADISLCTIIDQNNDIPLIDQNKNNDSSNDISLVTRNNEKNSSNDRKLINDKRINENVKPNDSSTNDSGFENETDTFTLLQTFLSELSGSMKLIYKFIDDSMAEFRNISKLESDKKKSIFDKATVTHGHLTGIIYKLECIINRESDTVTPLKEIILKADVVLIGDKRMVRYRQVVMKCLEQAQMLNNALRILLAITEGDYDVTFCGDISSFLNIFE